MCLGDVVVAFLAVCRWRRESEVVQCCLSLEMGDFTLNYDVFFGLADESDCEGFLLGPCITCKLGCLD